MARRVITQRCEGRRGFCWVMKEAILIPLRFHIVSLKWRRSLASRGEQDSGFKAHPQVLGKGKAQVGETLGLLHEMKYT